ncbi:MAG TPA: GNAT family N-acetyltransferase [Patescibacteria group bacterium]|nr:GNAT family N-acetyltransferase [Patescibacteria group bacterium]
MEQQKIKVKSGSCLCTFYNNGKANVMIIDVVEVEKAHRRMGIGTELLDKALALAKDKNVDSVELVVNKDNLPAKKLYEKVGFTKINKDFYRKLL